MGCRLWGRTESDTTEATWQQSHSRCPINVHFLPTSSPLEWSFGLIEVKAGTLSFPGIQEGQDEDNFILED